MKLMIRLCLAFTLVLLFHDKVFTQNYLSIFGNENTKWDQPFCNLDFQEVQQHVSEQEVVFEDQTYKQVGTVIPNGISYDMNSVSGNGYAREDLALGKAWFVGVVETIEGIDTLEYLIMDLSLEEGETFVVYEFGGLENLATVDSVYFENGLKYVRTNYQFWSNDDPLTFIEGVGTNYGIAYMHNYLNMCPCLISIKKDFDLVYSNMDCQPEVVRTNDFSRDHSILIFPNPSTDYITIQSNSYGFSYQIITLDGRELMNGKSESYSLQLDVSNFDDNWYIIRVDNIRQKVFIGKG
jgi:hypothetical protein